MSNEGDLAALLGATPRSPDPGFRMETLARAAMRASRRAAWVRALRLVLVSLAVGLLFAGAQAAGFSWRAAEPLGLTVGVLCLAAVFALFVTGGGRATLAWLQAPLLRA